MLIPMFPLNILKLEIKLIRLESNLFVQNCIPENNFKKQVKNFKQFHFIYAYSDLKQITTTDKIIFWIINKKTNRI